MSSEDASVEDQWPLPPPWMFACAECVRLYQVMKRVQAETEQLRRSVERGVDWDPFDRVVGSQVALGRHMGAAHRELLPDWDPACEMCELHRERLERTSPARPPTTGERVVAAEHRAYHLVVPPRVRRLM